MNTYTIYTDGACHNNGKPKARAGWGAVLTNPQGDTLEIAGPVPEGQPQTNGRAELMAVVEALERCTQVAPITLYTDSEYIAKALQGWLASWKAKGWRKADKKPPEQLPIVLQVWCVAVLVVEEGGGGQLLPIRPAGLRVHATLR